MSRKKFQLRATRASGSTRRLVDRAIAAGWRPGLRVNDVLGRQTKFTGGRNRP